jgi:hypothetical protein
MIRKCVIATLLLGSALSPGQSAPATSQPVRESFTDRYGVIAQRNIFLRERTRPRDHSRDGGSATTRRAVTPLTPEQAYVLRGIVLEENDLRAYFEDKRTGEVTRVATGAGLAQGRVAEIQIDAVRFQNAGQLVWVEIGHDLTGSQSAGGPAVAAPSIAPAAAGTDPSLMSVEERMRQRRQQRANPR